MLQKNAFHFPSTHFALHFMCIRLKIRLAILLTSFLITENSDDKDLFSNNSLAHAATLPNYPGASRVQKLSVGPSYDLSKPALDLFFT